MSPPRTDKLAVVDGGKAEESPAPFRFDPIDASGEPEVDFGIPSTMKRQEDDGVVQGVDLSGKPKVVLLAGRGKTGKTTNIRWMCERAMMEKRSPFMADLDPTNATFSTYFGEVNKPQGADNSADWLERFIAHGLKAGRTIVVDLGGGDTTLRSLVDGIPDLTGAIEEQGGALVMLYHIGPQIDDLAPIATMAERGFQPEATAIIHNLASIGPGLSREQAFTRIHRHRVFAETLGRGAIPVWMPRLHCAEVIEARRLRFIQARDGGKDAEGRPSLDSFNRARVRFWLGEMDRLYAGIKTWLP